MAQSKKWSIIYQFENGAKLKFKSKLQVKTSTKQNVNSKLPASKNFKSRWM